MKTKAYLYIVTGAALWGFIGLFVNILAARGFTPMQIVALRAVAAAIGITLVLFKLGRQYFVIDWRDLWLFCGTGVISLTFFNYCFLIVCRPVLWPWRRCFCTQRLFSLC